MKQLTLNFGRREVRTEHADPVVETETVTETQQLTEKPSELWRLVAYGNWDEWQRLASEFELKDLFPKGTDLSKVPYWVRKFWH